MSISLPGLEVGIAMCLDELAHFLCVYERSPTAEPNESGCVTLSVTYRAPRGSHIAFNARMRPEDDAPWPYVLRLQHCNGGSGAEGGQAASMMSRHWPSEFDEREQEWWATNAAMRSASGAQEFVAAETTTTLSMMHASDDGGEKLVWKKTPSFVVKFIHEHADQAQCTPDAPVKIQPAAQAIHVPTPRKRCKEDESGDTEADLKRIKPDPHASHENGFASSPSAAAPRQPQAASAITIADDDEERDSSPERPLQELHQVKTEYLERLIQRRKDERDDDRKAREGILEILKNERAKTLKNLTQAETQLDEIPKQAAERQSEEQLRFDNDMDKHRRGMRSLEDKMVRREAEFAKWKHDAALECAAEMERAHAQRDKLGERVRELSKQVGLAEETLGKKRGPSANDVVLTLDDSDGEEAQ